MVSSISVNDQNQIVDTKASESNGLDDVGFDTFLTLLTVQLQNQDPLNPMEGTEFTEQIATFSQLEQQIKSNDRLETIAEQNNYSAQAVAVSYIGKEVLAPGTDFELTEEGQSYEFAYELDKAANNVLIEVLDNFGQTVTLLNPEHLTSGTHLYTWDGTVGAEGELAPAGKYTLRISASADDESVVTRRTHTYGHVTSVDGSSDDLTLYLSDGRSIGFNNAGAVRESQQTTTEQPTS